MADGFDEGIKAHPQRDVKRLSVHRERDNAGVRRSNTRTPRYSSSARTRRLIAVGVTASSAAACLKLRWRAAASNARNEDMGGSRRIASP